MKLSQKRSRQLYWVACKLALIALTYGALVLQLPAAANLLKFTVVLTLALNLTVAVSWRTLAKRIATTGRQSARTMPPLLDQACSVAFIAALASAGWYAFAALAVVSFILEETSFEIIEREVRKYQQSAPALTDIMRMLSALGAPTPAPAFHDPAIPQDVIPREPQMRFKKQAEG